MDDFLNRLPDTLTGPGRRFFRLWSEWRRGRKLPELRDVDLAAMGDLARSRMLFDIRNRHDMRIVMAGETLREWLGVDLTGANYLDLTLPEYRETRARLTLEQVLQPCGVMLYYCLRYPNGAVRPIEFVGAPVCADGEDVPGFILASGTQLGPAISDGAPPDPDSYRIATGMRFIDLGYGVPPANPNIPFEQAALQ
ncbi:MAG TPA: PAS domain-containing protein [Ferrovibrio sp.]|uniref:PAS domain-containing protein n=1 Tax=Ferrovibrio sp. TaxID=1917215 RepID=UPI002B4B1547|nr:PAS domain-containing protein [Ferrovibrio sp.]HLT75765.1 PAS domain-containing protein [Ferrovibrio sp.]